jgi:cellulose synthase/poly-beta-1,6-N-acetylglucosamine synthase-like glycosyltransferase
MWLLAWLLASPLILMLLIFSLEVFAGLLPSHPVKIAGLVPKTAVLIPAHNEAATIAGILQPLVKLLSERLQLLVVADNCSDNTAEVAEHAGARVIERNDLDRRGKGYALAFGREFLRNAPPDVVIVIDADCSIDAQSIQDLALWSLIHSVPVQARYVLAPDLGAPPKVQISNFAFWVKNVVRQRGGKRLGSAAIMGGTGMALPWPLFETLSLATSNIVEDLALAIETTAGGRAPLYLDQAQVISPAASEAATLGQRSRWEHGFLTMAREHAVAAIGKGIVTRNRKLIQLGLHLLVPPLALLFMLSLAGIILLGVSAIMGGPVSALFALVGMTAVAGAAVLTAWAMGGRQWLAASALIRLPFYLIWKLPVYLRLAKGDTSTWTRTDRTDNGQGG